MSQTGQLQQTDFFDNIGGTNLADSAFKVTSQQAAGGYNFDYILTGGIRKRLGLSKLNTSANSDLKSLGLGLHSPASGSTKSVIRAAGTHLQFYDVGASTFTNLTEDTVAAGSAFLVGGSTQTVSFEMFNNGVSNVLWAAGGGMTIPYGAYSTTKATKNGVPAPTASSFTAASVGSGGTLTTGVYRYSLVFRKTSTQATSNAVLEASVTCVATDSVNLAWTLTNNDTTKYDKILVYRSGLNGATGFTTGDLVVTLASSATSYHDTGTSEASAQNVPRAGNILLDNSELPAGTYNAITTFKRRLVVATAGTVYLSDVNKSESWPLTNVITVPSAGNITGLAVISFTAPQANSLDELLVIFKEREIWVITGTDYTDFALKFIDQVGCLDQSVVVTANGFLAWIDYRGVYLWDGGGKPIYTSRLLEPLFNRGGDLDKAKLNISSGSFFRRENQIIWFVSSRRFGEQVMAIKLDLRLTMPKIEQQLTGRSIEAVLIQDVYPVAIYASLAYIPVAGEQEELLVGDNSGFCYYASNANADGGQNYSFTYLTSQICKENPTLKKRFHSVIVWVESSGGWDLNLDYWTDFKSGSTNSTTQSLPIGATNPHASAIWDSSFWDDSFWDSATNDLVPIIFNLQSGSVNTTEGSAIQLQFRNEIADQPIVIHGFSVLWSPLAGVSQ